MPPTSDDTTSPLSRRSLVRAAALTTTAVPLLAACGGEEDPGLTPDGASPGSSGGAASELVQVADVPVGGGVIVKDEKVVVTQPTEGDIKAFSATCTHSGCPVGSVNDGVISCPCHGSKFSTEDGSVLEGPANAPLESIAVKVRRGAVVRG